MSKSVKKIIGVVAAIAIPFAAPAIAGSIGLSAGVSSALGVSAATGATIGSALTGAALGAATGAITGQDIGRAALMGGIGGGVSGYLDPATAAGLREVSVTGSRYALAPGTAAGVSAVPAATAAAATAPTVAGATAPAAAGAGGAAAPTTVSQALRATFTPEKIADFTLRAAGQLAGSALAGEGLTAGEQALLDAQTQELAWLQQNNRALFEQRLQEAQNLLGEARYFDPQYFGLQAARRQQLAGATQERESLRGLTGARRAAEQRRIRLGTARNVGTAYDVGFGTGVLGRLQTRQAGLAALPTAAPATYGGYEGLLKSYEQARKGREQTLGGMGDLFGSFTGRQQAGLETPEDEEKKRNERLGA